MNNLFYLIFGALILSFLLTPLVKKIAIAINAIDVPKDERRVHDKPIPRLGGLAIYLSFIIVLGAAIIFNIIPEGDNTRVLGLVISITIITLGGAIDDTYCLKPWQKLSFQLAAAIVLMAFGISIRVVTNPIFSMNQYLNIGIFAYPFTILWIIGITNALNLIDGLDGLSAGVSFISCATIMIIALLQGRTEAAILSSILCGAILGFLPYNFNPASIFMGDTGAQLLGFMLAAISMEGAIKSATAFAIAVPILAIGLPIYDTLFAMVRRKVNGKPISQGDRGHLHHRLLDMGLSQKQAVIIMYMISAVLGAIAIIAMESSNSRAYFLLASVMIVIVFIAWRFGFFEHRE